ncbi:alpha-L-fucosidase [Sphingobacterium sp. E70]|uniref:alpha-L-fucosidase n=1 Tax=Sphingobacterium sp. E70 TaxID=2853439 RepID=UPI00211CAB79|nr:alpha-L-fucosidase [Sphingobacterium sp. E70]
MYKVLKYKVLSILFFFVIKGYGQVDSQPYEGLDEWSKTKDHRMEWFRKARFGMFIHWGFTARPVGAGKVSNTRSIMQNGYRHGRRYRVKVMQQN